MKIIKIIKENIPRYIIITISLLIAAFNFNLLLKPINLVAGGSPGLALVLKNIIPLSTSEIINIIYIFTLILSIILLEKKQVFGILYASIVYPLFVNLTDNITNLISLNYHDILFICMISGIISGISNGLIYKNGFASSGIGIISPIMNKYFKVSISTCNFVMNTFIMILGGYYYGINIVLYAIILNYISSKVCNAIILGISQNKVVFIKSDNEKKVVNLLVNKYKLTSTIFIAEKDKNILMTVVKNRDYSYIKNDLLKIDENIFFTTDNCYEVSNKKVF